ncbi:MAG: phospho-N-acetylmuramoyl-pentapeptide-transferase, partial [Clostridia bacterium]|nr:phospho-N-acetylmuramoyl-pentapeptide-transferase [Clostridia bacterium]
LTEYSNLSVVCYCVSGALLAYYIYNCFPAKVFMGDTGSLALGGLLCAIAIFTKTTLYIPIIGIMYVLTAVSDVVQVLYFKATKKRIFKMAPLHHHFQMSGVNENRITIIYIIVTMIISILTIALIMSVGGYV